MRKDIIKTKSVKIKVGTEIICDICKKSMPTTRITSIFDIRTTYDNVEFYHICGSNGNDIDICSKECLHKFIDYFADQSPELDELGLITAGYFSIENSNKNVATYIDGKLEDVEYEERYYKR